MSAVIYKENKIIPRNVIITFTLQIIVSFSHLLHFTEKLHLK